jgi:hypothetical protein
MRLGMSARREIYEAHYRRYQKAGKILDELVGTTGINRDHLAHVLASYGKKQKVESEGKEEAFIRALIRIREAHRRPCGKLLAPARKALELRGVSTTRAAGTSLCSLVPVKPISTGRRYSRGFRV